MLVHRMCVRSGRIAITLAALFALHPGMALASRPVERAPSLEKVRDLAGRFWDLMRTPNARASVYIFVSTQCPISSLYMPRIREIATDYTAKQVRFFLIDSNSEDTPDRLLRYARTYRFTLPIIKDRGTEIADWLSADRTPEAVLVDASGDIRYRGRIDDSTDRSRALHHDLREALDDLLSGRPVTRPRTISFGCAIFRDSLLRPHTGVGSEVTYTRDVAPILNRRCVDCHRAGEVAPFALQTYQEARTWAAAVKDYTGRRIMPPWKAVAGHGDFLDARGMSDQEIATLARWADRGAPEGRPGDLLPAPRFPEHSSWALGKPDKILQPDRPYHLSAEGPDVYRNYVLPIDFKQDRYLSAMEFRPGNRAVVHHIVLYVDPTGRSAEMDGKEAEPGYTVPGVTIGIPGAEWGEVWVPGRTPRFLPTGVAVKIPAGSKLVMQVHYHKNGAPQTDVSKLALYYSKGVVDQEIDVAPMLNSSFVLEPGNAHQVVRSQITVPVAVHIRAIFPHMHLLGREMSVTATLPDGTTRSLIEVTDWDFNWQETYMYRDAVALPAGTRLNLVAVFDNSERNPRQTAHPPKEVRWGEQTTDEMCLAVIGFTVDDQRLGIKLASFSGKP